MAKNINNWVKTYDQGLPFTLLTPSTNSPCRENLPLDITLTGVYGRRSIMQIFSSIEEESVVTLDLETNGTDFATPYGSDIDYIVGIGLAWGSGRAYFDVKELSDFTYRFLLAKISTLSTRLVAHNVFFDFGFITRDCLHFNIEIPKWKACTYALYRFLATEGFSGQKWGLKSAQVDLLGWLETNEVELDDWLISNYHITNGPNLKQEETVEQYERRCDAWIEEHLFHEDPKKRPKPNKSRMHLAPSDILGKYCKLDCESTYLLYLDVLEPAYNLFESLIQFVEVDWRRMTELLIEAKIRGVCIDYDLLKDHQEHLQDTLEKLRIEIYSQVDIEEWIAQYHIGILYTHEDKEPPKYKKGPKRPTEPKKHKKPKKIKDIYKWVETKGWELRVEELWCEKGEYKGYVEQEEDDSYYLYEVSKSWTNWQDKIDQYNRYKKEIRKDWLAWEEKWHKISNLELPKFRFNPNSSDQVRSLFYESGLIPYKIVREASVDDSGRAVPGEVQLYPGEDRAVILPTTKSGLLPTNGDALNQFGAAGEPFAKFSKADTELGYVTSYLEMLKYNETEDIYTIHPGYNVPGTLTGRLGGKEPNIQQIPVTYGAMRPWGPRPGFVHVECDHNSLEQVILAELSKDDTLDNLYGIGAKKNDVYLFVGSQLPGGIGRAIIDSGYDPDNPTSDTIIKAKKVCKRERSIAKVVVLASSYGAGAKKIWRTLCLAGIRGISLSDVKQILKTYWTLFKGVKRFESDLLEELRSRRGWFYNGIGRPIGLAERKEKDIVNQNCQSTGHDCHVIYTRLVADILDGRDIEWYPVIPDWHDHIIVECRPEDAEEVRLVLEEGAYEELDKLLQYDIKLSGEAHVVTNLAEAKVEDYDEIENQLREIFDEQ